MRPSWDEWGLGLAQAVSTRADCRRAKVGCVIVDERHRVVSCGYNGAPPGDPRSCLDGGCPRAYRDNPSRSSYEDCIALHAEQNAVANGDAGRMRNGTAYVTKTPCPMCVKTLQAAGIIHIVNLEEVS